MYHVLIWRHNLCEVTHSCWKSSQFLRDVTSWCLATSILTYHVFIWRRCTWRNTWRRDVVITHDVTPWRNDVIRDVVTYSWRDAVTYPDVTFTIHMSRRSLFYVVNLIFPCLLIYAVSFLGFFLPSESGDKVNLEITVLLALVVFLLITGETLPPTPDVMPALGLSTHRCIKKKENLFAKKQANFKKL